MKIMRYKKIYGWRIGFALSLMATVILLPGCANEDGLVAGTGGEEMIIRATVGGTDNVTNTRVNNSIYDITSTLYNLGFFIRVDGQNLEGDKRIATSRYQIPSGVAGMLVPADGQTELNWFARNQEHEIYSWTMPFLDWKNFTPEEDVLEQGFRIKFEDTDISETTSNTATAFKSDSWKNGQDLEKFIGGKTNKLTYLENGKYVELRMRHLVSKIMLKQIQIVNNTTGGSNAKIKGTITIYGMPNEITFYPCPKDEQGNNLQPYAEFDNEWDYPQNQSLTFAITNNSKTYSWEGHTSTSSTYYFADAWYIPPEVDFSELTYKIQLYEAEDILDDAGKVIGYQWVPDKNHGEHGAYFGSFKNMTFDRSLNGSNYDDAEDPGSDRTILHAGEYIVLNINMTERGTPSVQGVIKAWDGFIERTGHSHTGPGLYNQREFYEMQSSMSSSASTDKREEFYLVYGSGKTTADDPEDLYPDYEKFKRCGNQELKIIEVFEDIGYNGYGNSTTGTTAKVSSIYMPNPYILDGKGHTINVTGGVSNSPSLTSSATCQIGNVRDVYLKCSFSVSSGGTTTYLDYIVYIDKMGDVWTVDPVTFKETKTGYNVNNATNNPTSIDLKTGKVT